MSFSAAGTQHPAAHHHHHDQHHHHRSEPARQRPRRADRNRWNWLLMIGIVLPLVPGIFNRSGPSLLDIPFFIWVQLALGVLASMVTLIVHLKVR